MKIISVLKTKFLSCVSSMLSEEINSGGMNFDSKLKYVQLARDQEILTQKLNISED